MRGEGSAERIARILTLTDEEAQEIVLLMIEVDHLRAIKRYGYAKDNIVPLSLDVRLHDASYLAEMIDLESEEEAREPLFVALRRHLHSVQEKEKEKRGRGL